MAKKKTDQSFKYFITDEWMDLPSFLACMHHLREWYSISYVDVGEFIEKKFTEKYRLTRNDILNVISSAMETNKPTVVTEKTEVTTETPKSKPGRKPKAVDVDMYKTVQNALKNGMTKAEVQKKYKLNQRELTQYEGIKFWSDSQKEEHRQMLEYRRLHPDASDKECIEKGCKKSCVGYRYALVPTKPQQDFYNEHYKQNAVKEKQAPKAVIKGTDIKSLILSDKEKEEQEELYTKIKEIASARNIAPRDVTSLLKSRMVKDYGIVIEQIKKELMMKYRVNRGEGKAPNTLEAIVMSEYLPIAKSILDDMLTDSFSVR